MIEQLIPPGMRSVLGPRMQVGMVVRDLEVATEFWAQHLGIGPWIAMKSSSADRRFVHRGAESPVEMELAFSYAGDTQLEIIAQTNDAPSPYKEFLDEGREGVHHLGFWPEDFEGSCSALRSAGFEELFALYLPDGSSNVTYYSSPAFIGLVVELAPMTPFRRKYMTAIEKLAQSWDGSHPLRRFGSREEFIASDDFRRVEGEGK
ncbi:VOC family protein [Nocardioides pocheonensis]|nr:VOC family protein [Nocardioides pocheonensis]